MRIEFVHEHRHTWPVAVICRALEVSRSAYYQSRHREPSEAAKRRSTILDEIKSIRSQPKQGCYGSPRVHQEMLRKGIQCCVNTVAKIMKMAGISAKKKSRFRVATTDSNHSDPIAPNLLNQQFHVDSINQVWLTDFTYIPTAEGFTFVCAMEDLASRKIVGWASSRHIDSVLALAALNQAIAFRSPKAGLIVHSDRGSQYASGAFRKRLSDCGFRPSMSGKGNCYDNAPMESFFKSYKTEEVYHQNYATHEEATRGAADYIDGFYNAKRLHSALGYLSPNEYEAQLSKNQTNRNLVSSEATVDHSPGTGGQRMLTETS